MPLPRPVTLAAIAQATGFSRMTVSRVLQNRPGHSAESRSAILKTARKLGWRPDPVLSIHMAHIRMSDAKKFQAMIALGHFFNDDHGWKEALRSFPTLRRRTEEVIRYGESLGYRVEEFAVGPSPAECRALARMLRNRGFVGIIFQSPHHPGTHLEFPLRDLAASTFAYNLAGPRVHRATGDFYNMALDAARRLAARGYRRISIAFQRGNEARVNHLWRAAILVHQSEQPPEDRVPIFLTDRLDENGFQAFRVWTDEHRPDAIMSTDHIFREWLERAGYGVPRDVGFVDLDWSPEKGDSSGIDQMHEQHGRATVDVIVGQLSRRETGEPEVPRIVLIPGLWREGDSLKSPASRGRSRKRSLAAN
ncbi:MAG TPA: LacI family DNA-binding transcriptional regulator [Chthoniobacteraceae bacterium]|jgi:DNA-binding LacI/PurR family transcriptional regulator